jgi:transposase
MDGDEKQSMLDQIAQRDQVIARQAAEIIVLKQTIDALCRRIFGKSSEKLDPAQLEFVLGQLGRPATPPPPAAPEGLQPPARAPRAKPQRRQRIPENLPVTEEIIDPPEVTANPDAFRRIGEEITKRIAFTPGKFSAIHQIRGKYIAIDNPAAKPIIAPLPPSLLERGTADATFVAEIIYNRFGLHLPYYRQAEMFATLGVSFDRKTLCDHAMLGAEWLAIIYREIQAEHWRCRYRQFDETPIDYLKPGAGKAKTGYFWVSNIPGGSVFFLWQAGRGADGAAELFGEDPEAPAAPTAAELDELLHLIQCDGYSAYRTWAAKRPWLKLPGCNAHARRKFLEAMDQAPGLIAWILRQYGLLYQIEERLRKSKAGPALRGAVRASESRMIFQRLKRVIGRLALRSSILPKSNLGKAIHYALAQWPHLELFLTHGQVEIDNNLVENAIRPTKLGAKNWLFIGREEAGQSAAVLYTILVNCRRLGIDPREYLVDVLTRLPGMQASEAATLTPAAWQAARQGKTLWQKMA